MILGLAFVVFYEGTLYHFEDGSGELTTLFFWPHVTGKKYLDHDFNHTGMHYWWFFFKGRD